MAAQRRRTVLAILLFASPTLAQTLAEGAATAGVAFVPRTGFASAFGAVDVQVARTFHSELTVTANLVAQINSNGYGVFGFRDLGSTLRIDARPESWNLGEWIFLELLPFDGHRVRPVFDFANYWGAPARPLALAPVIVLGARRDAWTGWFAFQGYGQLDDLTLEPALRATALAGVSFRHPSGVGSELVLSIGDRGDSPGLANQGVKTSIRVVGGTIRVSWQSGGGVQPALDPQSLANDPARYQRLFAQDAYDVSRASYFSLESGVVSQNLEDPGVFGVLRRETTGFVDLQARVRLKWLRLYATFRYHPVALIKTDVPGIPPFKLFPNGTQTDAEASGLLGADYRFAGFGLIPGLMLRVVRPAWFATPTTTLAGPMLMTGRVVILQSASQVSILPLGATAEARFEAIASLRFDHYEPLSAILQISYVNDPNIGLFSDSPMGGTITRITSETVAVSLTAQARF